MQHASPAADLPHEHAHAGFDVVMRFVVKRVLPPERRPPTVTTTGTSGDPLSWVAGATTVSLLLFSVRKYLIITGLA